MNTRLLLLLAVVAIVAFQGGESWGRRRRRRRYCAPTFKSKYYSLLNRYNAFGRKYARMLLKYRQLVNYMGTVSSAAYKYGRDLFGLGKKINSQYRHHRGYAFGDETSENDLFADEPQDFDASDNENSDHNEMFEDVEEDFPGEENENESDLSELSESDEGADHNLQQEKN